MTMYVDDREGSSSLLTHIPLSPTPILTRLPFGDVHWMGNGVDDMPVPIGVEYKTISDLCNCIITGRLSGHQLLGMVNEFWRSYLLIEGLWRPAPSDGILETWKRGGWTPLSLGSRRFMAREVWNYINTISVMCGIMVVQTSNIWESGQWLAATYSWWNKKWEQHHSHRQFHCAPPPACKLTRPNLVHRMAKELEGVGWDKAEALSREFTNMGVLAMAGEDDLRKVDGIGKVLAKRIVKQLRGE